MTRQELRTCPSCFTNQVVNVKKTNHILHAVMSIITLGAWLIVWLAMAFESSMPRLWGTPKCLKCGHKIKG